MTVVVPLRVASVPAAHPYVAHLELGAAGIDVLPDPRPPGAPPGRWWPPVVLDPAWISEHAGSFDVLHVHFGAESLSTGALSRALDALEQAGRPLVYTVHDLENPQLADQSRHREQLDLLIPRASEIITLTRGAAVEITQRWGALSTVIPHPRMLSTGGSVPEPADSSAPAATTFEVGVHLRDLRPSIDGPGVARALAGAVGALRAGGIDAHGTVSLFDNVRDAAEADAVRAAVSGAPQVVLVQAPRLSDAALVADLSRLDVSVLPYRHGTHSGWAELCWDLGVAVAGAPIGYIAEQHDEPGWFSACDPTDAVSLARALDGPARQSPPDRYPRPGAPRGQLIVTRRAQRAQLARGLGEAHRMVYLRALGR